MPTKEQVANVLRDVDVPLSQINNIAPDVEAKAKRLRAEKNLSAFGDLIAKAEGTAKYGSEAYKVAFGGKLVNDLSQHPNISTPFKETTGKKNRSTAAGKYQFTKSTWDDVAKKTGLTAFTPENQEANFRQLLKDRKVYDHVASGDYSTAIHKLGSTFASLPSSPYNQPKRSWEEMQQFVSGSPITITPQTTSGVRSRGRYKAPDIRVANEDIVESLLPDKNDSQAMAANQQRNDMLSMFEAQHQEARNAVNARKTEIDNMLSDAFGFNDVFAKKEDSMPKDYDDKLLKLIDMV